MPGIQPENKPGAVSALKEFIASWQETRKQEINNVQYVGAIGEGGASILRTHDLVVSPHVVSAKRSDTSSFILSAY